MLFFSFLAFSLFCSSVSVFFVLGSSVGWLVGCFVQGIVCCCCVSFVVCLFVCWLVVLWVRVACFATAGYVKHNNNKSKHKHSLIVFWLKRTKATSLFLFCQFVCLFCLFSLCFRIGSLCLFVVWLVGCLCVCWFSW